MTDDRAGVHRCPDCGAQYADAGDSCAVRFDALLALDHSRREPWGSRHALAFAAFALQHQARFPAASVERARTLLERVFVRGEPLAHVVREFRAAPRDVPVAGRPPVVAGYGVTIADLGAFDAEGYAEALERWCRAALGGTG